MAFGRSKPEVVPFEDFTGTLDVPVNQRVVSVDVTSVDGIERVVVVTEGRPLKVEKLATVVIQRPNEPSDGGKFLESILKKDN